MAAKLHDACRCIHETATVCSGVLFFPSELCLLYSNACNAMQGNTMASSKLTCGKQAADGAGTHSGGDSGESRPFKAAEADAANPGRREEETHGTQCQAAEAAGAETGGSSQCRKKPSLQRRLLKSVLHMFETTSERLCVRPSFQTEASSG